IRGDRINDTLFRKGSSLSQRTLDIFDRFDSKHFLISWGLFWSRTRNKIGISSAIPEILQRSVFSPKGKKKCPNSSVPTDHEIHRSLSSNFSKAGNSFG